MRGYRRGWIAVLPVALAIVVGVLVNADQGLPLASEDSPDVGGVGTTEAGRPPARPQSVMRAGLREEFARWEAQQPNRISVAVAPVGGGEVLRLGAAETDPTAWSTIKVPLTIAVTGDPARQRDSADLNDQARAAIVESDNEAALALRRALGDDAPARVNAVLARLGDTSTRFDPNAFGQTRWSVENQAVVAAELPCEPTAAPTYALMGQITEDHSWGLGRIPDTHFKGGWGNGSAEGHFVVRQFGVMPTRTGQVAVAINVDVVDGAYESGTAAVDATVAWLARYIDSLPSGRCA